MTLFLKLKLTIYYSIRFLKDSSSYLQHFKMFDGHLEMNFKLGKNHGMDYLQTAKPMLQHFNVVFLSKDISYLLYWINHLKLTFPSPKANTNELILIVTKSVISVFRFKQIENEPRLFEQIYLKKSLKIAINRIWLKLIFQ